MVCERCNGDCCRKFVIFVTAHDAARIVDGIKLEATYFLNAYPAKINSKFPVFKVNGSDCLLGMDSKHGATKDCKFLMDVGTSRRCGIHGSRPMICRTYPFVSDPGGLDFVEEVVCPKQWWPENEEREQYIRDIRQLEKELGEYEKIVGLWNRNFGEKGSFAEFLGFILNEVKT